jgi:ELWxxDGT repeat protein
MNLLRKLARHARTAMAAGLAATALLAAAAADAGPIYLVKDLNPNGNGMTRASAVANGDHVVFWGSDALSGAIGNPWRTDGTEAGTMLIKPIMGSQGFFQSIDHAQGGLAYFRASDGLAGFEQVWRTDGTASGTIALTTTDLRTFGVGAEGITGQHPHVWFTGKDPASSARALWRSDGTLPGTAVAPVGNVASRNGMLGERALFNGSPTAALASRVYRTDGSAAGTVELSTLVNAFASGTVEVNEVAYFVGTDSASGAELWITDGTSLGTRLVKDIQPGAASASPQHLTRVDDRLFFTAIESTGGRELWVSDGTTGGTVRVKDIRAGLQDGAITSVRALDGLALFFANDGVTGLELWRSDGTEAGTSLVKDIVPGSGGSGTFSTTVVANGKLYVHADGDLWRSDGTPAGTTPVDESQPIQGIVAAANGKLFVQAFFGTAGQELGAVDLVSTYGPEVGIEPEAVVGEVQPTVSRLHLRNPVLLTDLDVALDLHHPVANDLQVTLRHVESGKVVTLLERPRIAVGGAACSGRLVDIVLDDEAASDADTSCASTRLAYPRNATRRPTGDLSVFDGQSLAGTWELSVSDAVRGGATGHLHGWRLIGTGSPITDTVFAHGFE